MRENFHQTELSVLWEVCCECFDDPRIGNVVCIVDALNECESSSRSQFLRLLKEYKIRSKEGKIKFLATGRPDAETGVVIGQAALQLKLEADAPTYIESDVERVIRREIDIMPALERWSEDRKKQLHTRLFKNSDKTFLWVALILHLLPYALDASEDTFNRTLALLPNGIHEVYETILESVPLSNR